MSLEPIDAENALELYLADKENELSEASLKGHKYRLGHFVRWCNEVQEIKNLNTLTGRQLHRYRLWRREDGDLNKVSEKTQMDTLRVFVRWLESIDGVEQDLSEKVLSPSVTPDENSRDVMLDSDSASKVLAHLKKYEYASIQHVSIVLMWHTMMRVGGVHALDIEDYNPGKQYIKVRHRPDTGTPIKNKNDGERMVALSDQLCEVLDDWLDAKRPVVTDDYGREPLLASREGRTSKTTLRAYVYRWTRPCVYSSECPHDRGIGECSAVERDTAYECPSSVSPHAIRRGSITHSLNSDMPDKVVSDRANVSQRVIEQHYDRRTEREKMEQRRDYLDNL
ncbi:tyrosine-type recombinase/integrase [Halodesulfurarchaeum formicicum]|uniref:Integrase n=1 Tax=Halodesulfurarchaeum formicicum TaxID=1873524 RepID=A0A1J1ACV7_9EURY|nr:site-specific integrase [Halodesulfurarchaeum formicicum]APE95717.1 integrase [Halodesulfurarchaeum formicicum]